MLGMIPHRGDRTDTLVRPGLALGYRWWGGRPGKSQGIFQNEQGACVCAGTLSPAVANPAEELAQRLKNGDFEGLDGAFVAASWDGQELKLIRDPFGVRSIYVVQLGDTVLFASELKQLLAVPAIPVELDLPVVHKYLTFSFVPGKNTPIRGIKRLLPGKIARLKAGELHFDPWFILKEQVDPDLSQAEAVRLLRLEAKAAVKRRLNGERTVGLFLSGGLDSSAVGLWLKHHGQETEAFSLDFGEAAVEREQAESVAKTLGFRHQLVRATGGEVGKLIEKLAWLLDLPFGDPVTGPQALLAQTAKSMGITAVFNGEGGDQLFGGWTSKPMVAMAAYQGLFEEELSPEEEYLKAYHRFYGLEEDLYTPEFAAAVGTPGQRRALIAPFLGDSSTSFYLNRVRLTDLHLKGSQNILPRAERVAAGEGMDIRVPLFDRKLAEFSFRLAPSLKLHGACEKYVLKLALQDRLPDEIVWRRKFGMSVPITDWLIGPRSGGKGELFELCHSLLGPDAVKKRGWFKPEFVAKLLEGESLPGEVRRRRAGEKLWTLLALELWARAIVDRRGRV
jgi:asparagine synthase (glutamine-hydrolysing)